MTAPNVDFLLPKTYVFRRAPASYGTRAPMARVDAGGAQYLYLPLGLSLVTVTATSMPSARLELTMNQGTDSETRLASVSTVGEPTVRLWTGQISNAGTNQSDGGVYLRIYAERVTSVEMANGSVSVQVVNFPPET